MFVLAINHAVADYDKWKAAYDSMPPTSRGATFARVNRSVDDPNQITVVSGFETVEAARSFANAPELKEKMMEAGVTGSPRIELYEEVEAI